MGRWAICDSLSTINASQLHVTCWAPVSAAWALEQTAFRVQPGQDQWNPNPLSPHPFPGTAWRPNSLGSHPMCSWENKEQFWDFTGSPVVKTPRFHCRGCPFDPRSGNYDPACHAVQPKQQQQQQTTTTTTKRTVPWPESAAHGGTDGPEASPAGTSISEVLLRLAEPRNTAGSGKFPLQHRSTQVRPIRKRANTLQNRPTSWKTQKTNFMPTFCRWFNFWIRPMLFFKF